MSRQWQPGDWAYVRWMEEQRRYLYMDVETARQLGVRDGADGWVLVAVV